VKKIRQRLKYKNVIEYYAKNVFLGTGNGS
jgi:hypothetical protein